MKKTIVITLLCLFSGIGMLVLTNHKKESNKTINIRFPWNTIRKDDLFEITIREKHHKNTIQYTIKKEEGSWVLLEPVQIKTRTDNVLILVNAFLSLHAVRQLDHPSEQDLEAYGLLDPILDITGATTHQYNHNTSKYRFLVGKTTPEGAQYYVQILNNPEKNVYIVKKELLEPFLQGIVSIIDTEIISQPIDQILSIEFKNLKHDYIKLTNINQFWIQTEPSLNKNMDWGTRRFLLTAKNLTFNPKNIRFDVSEKMLKDLNINILSSPKLKLYFNDKSTLECFLGIESKNTSYFIYIVPQNIIVDTDISVVQPVFETDIHDFITHK